MRKYVSKTGMKRCYETFLAEKDGSMKLKCRNRGKERSGG